MKIMARKAVCPQCNQTIEDKDNFKIKYLKYKNKYLQLKSKMNW